MINPKSCTHSAADETAKCIQSTMDGLVINKYQTTWTTVLEAELKAEIRCVCGKVFKFEIYSSEKRVPKRIK